MPLEAHAVQKTAAEGVEVERDPARVAIEPLAASCAAVANVLQLPVDELHVCLGDVRVALAVQRGTGGFAAPALAEGKHQGA